MGALNSMIDGKTKLAMAIQDVGLGFSPDFEGAILRGLAAASQFT